MLYCKLKVMHSKKVDSAVLCLTVFPALVLFFQYEYKFVQEKTHQDWRICPRACALNDFVFAPPWSQGQATGEHLHTVWTRTGWSWISQLVMSNETWAPDWLPGALCWTRQYFWLALIRPLRVQCGCWAELNNESRVCCVFFCGAVYLFLPGRD